MANPILRAILSSLLIWGSSLLVPHSLHAQAPPGWGTAALIETNPGIAFIPEVGMDDNGNAIAVWLQYDGTIIRIWSNRYVAGQGWGTPERIETNPGDADFPRVAVNRAGNA